MFADTIETIDQCAPFALKEAEKNKLFLNRINYLNQHHYENCAPYQNIINFLGSDKPVKQLSDAQYLPVQLFKHKELYSIKNEDIVKTMTSSGTSGQQVSKIFLDKKTANKQTKVLSKIVKDFIGGKRLPMLIIDTIDTIKKRSAFSARTAAIRGFSIFAKSQYFLLNGDLSFNENTLHEFHSKFSHEPFLIFGFTSFIYEKFISELEKRNLNYDLSQATLIHGGGWKKLESKAISNHAYKEKLKSLCNITRVHNYYGMVEQTGSIFMECEEGRLHCSNYSDILIRDEHFQLCGHGENGLIQLLSLLPGSYPGHNILTEDMGKIIGIDDCPCGRKGKTFQALGRAAQAELRGCSDVS